MADPVVVVLVPWRATTAQRVRCHDALGPHLASFGWPVVEADSGHEPFSSANSLNAASDLADARGGRWDIAVLHEADCWVPTVSLHRAVDLVAEGHDGLAYAYDEHRKLRRGATDRFLAGVRDFEPGDYKVGRYRVGGPRAIARATWDRVGGFDERFLGWGYEDNAFRDAVARLAGHVRVHGPLLNLWHPRQDPGDPYYQRRHENYALLVSLGGEGAPPE